MTDRRSQTILLCEDEVHKRLVTAYMKQCGLPTKRPYLIPKVASDVGGNDVWVIREFARELEACRKRHAKTLLIVVLDADKHTVAERRSHLDGQLNPTQKIAPADPLALLIPRRQIETWIRALLGESVTEEQNCKAWKWPAEAHYRRAAETAYQWARPNATPGPTCVDSLRQALPEWRKIG